MTNQSDRAAGVPDRAGGVPDRAGGVTIRFPANSGYLSLCRVNATAFGAMLGFDLDTLDDLRLAVTEAVTWNLEGAQADTELEVRLADSEGVLNLAVTAEVATDQDAEMDDLASAILGAMVDEFTVSTGAASDGSPTRTVALTKSKPTG